MLAAGSLILAGGDVKIRTERPDAVYKVGETVRFLIEGGKDKQLEYVIYGLDGRASAPKKLEKRTVAVHAEKPGFVQIGVRESGRKRYDVFGGAAIAPEQIRKTSPKPADFDSFWNAAVAELRKSGFEVRYETVREDLLLDKDKIICREVFIRAGNGLTAAGFVAWPANAQARSLPILANFNGASKVIADARWAQTSSRNPAIGFNLNFHGLDSQLDRSALKQRMSDLSGYQYKNADHRDLYPMKNIFLRVVLALDYLKTLPQWDGDTIIVRGGSLGGCQALVAAALDPDVDLCIAGAAAMCDHNGGVPGWPRLLERVPQAAAAAPYFDAANFASRIRCHTVMTVGFIDRTCPPASTYAAYHCLPPLTEKRMYHVPLGDHNGRSPDKKGVYYYGTEEIRELIRERMKK